jgi:hypothetical protein
MRGKLAITQGGVNHRLAANSAGRVAIAGMTDKNDAGFLEQLGRGPVH